MCCRQPCCIRHDNEHGPDRIRLSEKSGRSDVKKNIYDPEYTISCVVGLENITDLERLGEMLLQRLAVHLCGAYNMPI